MRTFTVNVVIRAESEALADELRDEITGSLGDAFERERNFDFNASELLQGDVLKEYTQLHDTISNLVEGGLLRQFQEDYPADYQELVEQLASLANR